MTRGYDSPSSKNTVYMGSSLPPGVDGQQKGKLTIQLQEVDWQGTPNLQSGCSLYINWWGQAAADNLILVIPNGSCPPAITAVYPLVSSMKQVSRYFQDMGTLDLCLVVGKHDTSAGEPGVSLGNFSLEVANLSEDVQIQGSHAVFDKARVFLAIVSLKVSLSYFSNGVDAKGTGSDKSTLLGKSFDDLVAQRLNLLKEKVEREQQSPSLQSAVLKVEDIGRSFTAQLRSSFAETEAKGYGNFGQRKEIVMDFELPQRIRPSSGDSLDTDRFEISPRKQMVMDAEVRTPPKDVTPPKKMDQFSQRRQLLLDVEVPPTDRGHLSPTKHVEQFSERKQLVMDIDLPPRDTGHSQFPFDATSPRIALLEGDVPSEDGSRTKTSAAEHPQELVTKDTGDKKNTSSTEMASETKIKSSRSPRIQDYGRAKTPRAKQRDIIVTTSSKSRSFSAPAGMKADTNSSRPSSPSRAVTRPRGNQPERKGETTPLNSRTVGARPRFVGLPQGKQQQGIKPVSRSRGKSTLSDSEFPIGRDEGKYSSTHLQTHTPISSSSGKRREKKALSADSSLGVGQYSRRQQLVMDVEVPSRNRGHAGFPSKLISSSRQREQMSTKDTQEPLEAHDTGHLPSPTTQQSDSHSSKKERISPRKRKAAPVKQTRAHTPHRNSPDRNRPKTPVKQKPYAPRQTPDILTPAEELELNLKEESKKSCELHSRSPETILRVPATILVSAQPSPPRKSKVKTKKTTLTTEQERECDLHLVAEGYTAAATEQQLKSGWHELAGNLAILPGDDPCSPNMGESKSEEIFQADSLERLINRLEAFQQALRKSSSAAPIVDTKGKKSLDLSERIKDVDENISSISRHLTRLMPDDHHTDSDDESTNARVVTIRNEKLAGEDVNETKTLEELSYRRKKIEEPRQCKDVDRKHLDDVCDVHCGRPKQAAPMDNLLSLETLQNFNEKLVKKKELNSTKVSRAPLHLHDSCEVHGDPQHDSEYSPDFNLRLFLTVGKITFEELVLRELSIAHPSGNLTESAFGLSTVQRSSCLLTVSVPALSSSTHRRAEQGLSISPVSLGWKEAYFGHESQLNWSGLRRDTLKLWISQAMKVIATLSWDSGDSLKCEGSVCLGRVIDSMPKCYRTNLELHRVTKLQTKSQYTCEPMSAETPPAAAKIEIGITLLMENIISGKPEMMESWLYVSIHSITGCIPRLKKRGGIGHLHLIVRADKEENNHIPFLIDCGEEDRGVITWRLCKRRQSDAVFRAPKQLDDATLFIEVWQDWRGHDSLRHFASHNFIGLVKIPLEACQTTPSGGSLIPGPDRKGSQGPGKKGMTSFHGRVEDKGVVAAEGDFSIWNPLKDVICGSLRLGVVLGSEAEMLNLQQRDRAARIIQSYVRCFTERTRTGKDECVRFAGKHNRFADQQFPEGYKGGVTRHVLEVTVQHATDLPTNESLKGADSARCEGAFIKYLFPCDREPFYTQDMRWGRSVFFSASVHHGIILPASENLEAHLIKMRAFSKNDGDLLFELWGCFTDDLDEQTYFPNKLRLSDAGEPASWDMRREKYVNSEKKSAKREPRERLIGTCKLPQKTLLHMISEKRRSLYLSPEVRKKFYLPVEMDMSQLETYRRAPTLVVQIAYFLLEIEDRKAHMVDSIFSGTHLSEDSLLEATLEIDILRATGLQSAVREVEVNSRAFSGPIESGLNSYVRYSLFPSNRQLELIYPPGITSIKANDLAPRYKWTGELKIILNVQVLRELRTGSMCFEVWHHSYSHARTKLRPMVLSEESSATDICLGVATIPTRILLHSKQGITGWHDLSRKGVVVGSIKLAVSFRNWRIRPL